jgi:hypothetical protein
MTSMGFELMTIRLVHSASTSYITVCAYLLKIYCQTKFLDHILTGTTVSPILYICMIPVLV